MKDKNIINKFIKSIYDMQAIIRFSKKGVGSAIIYAVCLSLFLGMISGIVYGVQINNKVDDLRNFLIEDENSFKFENGELSFKKDSIKKNVNNIELYFNGSIDLNDYKDARDDIRYSEQYILFLKDGVYININSYNIKDTKIKYTEFIDSNFNNQDIINSLSIIKAIILVFNFIYSFMSLIVNYLLCAVMVSSIMNIVAKFRDNKLMFSNIFSITCYAATLPTILLSFIPMLFTNGMSFFIISMAGTIEIGRASCRERV